MSTPQWAGSCRITSVVNFDKWFAIQHATRFRVFDLWQGTYLSDESYSEHFQRNDVYTEIAVSTALDVIRYLYDKKIGEVGCYWARLSLPIDYKYATITFGELFEFFTTADGVLRVPEWSCMKYALDQYMNENPRTKFHPARVREFIQENGIEELESME